MTPEQEAFTKAITRLMRMGGKLFLLFWLLMCGAMGIIAICALLGVPDGAKFSGTPTVWAGVLLGSLAAAGLGWLFMRLWRRAIDSIGSHIPAALPTDASGDRQGAAEITDGRGISTSTHIGLQFVLTCFGGLIGFIIFVVFFRNSFASQLASGIVFVLAVGIGTVIPKLVMSLIPARCPNCSGRAYCRGSSPITFVCRNCNHIHNTGISLGSGENT
jgi:hypothetical protein